MVIQYLAKIVVLTSSNIATHRQKLRAILFEHMTICRTYAWMLYPDTRYHVWCFCILRSGQRRYAVKGKTDADGAHWQRYPIGRAYSLSYRYARVFLCFVLQSFFVVVPSSLMPIIIAFRTISPSSHSTHLAINTLYAFRMSLYFHVPIASLIVSTTRILQFPYIPLLSRSYLF
jgi:hypothetical protein